MESPLTAVCIQLLLLYSCFVVVQSQPTVITRPDALLTSSGNIVEGSVIQVYCTAEIDNGVSFTWTFNGSALLNDPPHIRIRTDKDGTGLTSVLTVDNFRDTDNGVYQCTASDETGSSNGTAVTFVAVPSDPNGTLMIVTQPSDIEPVDLAAILNDNRTGIALGATVDGSLLTCTVGHQGDGGMNYSLPSVAWVRNGQVVDDTDSRITITPTTMANGQLSSSLTITNFGQSDVGVYQCVSTDDSDGGDSEVITTIPYRLDTGNILAIERVSPEVIILRPPEKLVIEVRSSGEYSVHFWRKNENIYFVGFPVTLPDEFPNFAEIFVREPTTLDDEGVYRVDLQLKPGTEQTHQLLPAGGVDFAVIAPVDANTTALTTDSVVILEGGSADISCRSVGAPAPSITWELDNQITSFEQTDTVTRFEATFTGIVEGQREVDLTPGNIVSDLHIVSAIYPDHDGVYECIGTNADDLNVASSTAIVTVQVHVIPEVEITTVYNTVNIGDTRTLTCSILRGNPTNYTYSIVSLNTMNTTSRPTLVLTDIQQSDLGTYRCDVTNEAGTGSANITIELGVSPNATAVQPDPVVVDTDVDLVCIVTGSLPIEIIWTQTFDNGTTVEVFRGNDTTGGNFTLSVGANDYGSYTCSGTSHIGSDTISIDVVRAVAPLLPGDQSVEGVTGSSLILTVNITDFNLPLTNITWFIDDVLATEVTGREGNITITNTSTTSPPATSTFMLDLVQLPIELEDGLYSVMVTNDAGSDTTVFNVIVTSRSTVFSPNEDLQVSVSEGNDTSLLCRARGSPAPMFNWYRRSDTLMDGMGRISISSSSIFNATGLYEVTSELNITMVDRTDAGMYRCVASNTVLNENSEDDRTFNVTVNFVPTITISPINVSVVAPNPATFSCAADGVPLPEFTWIRIEDGTESEVMADNSTTIVNTNVTDRLAMSVLTFSEAQPSFSAMYRCVASNVLGSDDGTAELTVNDMPEITAPVENFTYIVDESVSVIFDCLASGIPAPTITWFRVNGSVFTVLNKDVDSRVSIPSVIADSYQPSDGRGTVFLVNSTLTLTGAMDNDSGTYSCQAVNDFGNARREFELVVQVAPQLITLDHTDVNTTENNDVMFVCLASALPRPVISWEFIDPMSGSITVIVDDDVDNNITTYTDGREVISALTVISVKPSDSGVYRCMATNIVGTISESATLTVYGFLLIQLRLKGVDRCQSWVAEDGRLKLDALNVSFASNIEERCQCGFSVLNIISPKFRCFPESEDAVTYRAEISGTPSASPELIATYIEQWLMQGAIVSFDIVQIQIDGSCQVVLTSILDPECNTPTSMAATTMPPTATTMPLTTIAPTTMTSAGTSSPLTAVVGGTLGAVVLLITIALLIIIVIIILIHRKKVGVFDVTKHRSKSGIELEDVTVNRGSQEAEYEDLDMYRGEVPEKTSAYDEVTFPPPIPPQIVAVPKSSSAYDEVVFLQPPPTSPHLVSPPPAEYDYVQSLVLIKPSSTSGDAGSKEFDFTQCEAYATTSAGQGQDEPSQ